MMARMLTLNLLCQDKWEKICSAQETTVEVFEHINLMTLDTIMKCAFSQETNCQINRSVTGKGKKRYLFTMIRVNY
jgi:hypothetical protein